MITNNSTGRMGIVHACILDLEGTEFGEVGFIPVGRVGLASSGITITNEALFGRFKMVGVEVVSHGLGRVHNLLDGSHGTVVIGGAAKGLPDDIHGVVVSGILGEVGAVGDGGRGKISTVDGFSKVRVPLATFGVVDELGEVLSEGLSAIGGVEFVVAHFNNGNEDGIATRDGTVRVGALGHRDIEISIAVVRVDLVEENIDPEGTLHEQLIGHEVALCRHPVRGLVGLVKKHDHVSTVESGGGDVELVTDKVVLSGGRRRQRALLFGVSLAGGTITSSRGLSRSSWFVGLGLAVGFAHDDAEGGLSMRRR